MQAILVLFLLMGAVVGEDIATLAPPNSDPGTTKAPAAKATVDPNILRVKIVPVDRVKQSPIAISHVLPDGMPVVVAADNADSVSGGLPDQEEEVIQSAPDDGSGPDVEEVIDEELGSVVTTEKRIPFVGADGQQKEMVVPVPAIRQVSELERLEGVDPQPAASPLASVPTTTTSAAKKAVGMGAVTIILITVAVVLLLLALLACVVVLVMKKRKKRHHAELAVVQGPAGPVLAAVPTDSSAQTSDSTSAPAQV